ncbi:helix-turn-helix domain-containing protein [Streptomyces sp. MI02-2A]|uniref:helix-turn-helix domain-containing protein n=1 Tax=unclassified Streptomyces TaxID=2593676 RepID=UPI0007412D08|nr:MULTISPECIES: helix-turn-helix domain-containing protein [unclassified Streptomyces]KUJ38513.1 ArsR family transcriptional regulator [Streptomyces sp. NRRL F-5122]MDX3258447.1 helix-turn-helix domain-containing protein [Streptomyces sp. MI02-2A]
MVQGNRLGDIEITDPKAMRALAHPVRLALLERLQRYGPATATQLSPHVGATPSVTSWHLRHLAGFGLVRDAEVGGDRRKRRWEAVARGFRVEVPEGGEGQSAAHALSRQMFAGAAGLPHRWLSETEPELEPQWRRIAGLANTRVVVTAEELAAIEDAMEAVLAPYVMRDPAQRPDGSRDVRLLRYFLPEAAAEERRGDAE